MVDCVCDMRWWVVLIPVNSVVIYIVVVYYVCAFGWCFFYLCG